MLDRLYMVPGPGLRVLHPAGSPKAMRPLPAGGEWVTLTDYWQRRIDDGDVTASTTEPAPPKATTKKEPTP